MDGGILLVDKPRGMTSADVVRAVTRHTGQKCGHLGTLDPMATGLLVVFMGNALRLVSCYQKGRKRYLAEVAFGSATDTYDAEGRVVDTCQVPDDLGSRLAACLPQFVGKQQQTVPAFSAVRVRGRRLYDLAREGREMDLPEREICIDALRMTAVDGPLARLDVTCSSGTYIRSLARDLGRAVGCPAHLAALRRVESAPFSVEEAVPLSAFLQGPRGIPESLLSPEDRLPELPVRRISVEEERRLLDGRRIAGAGFEGAEAIMLLSADGRIVAVGTFERGEIRTRRAMGG